MPAATKLLTPVRLATAGPSVQTILARRPFFSLIISAVRGRRAGVSGRAAGRDRLAPEEVVLRSPAISQRQLAVGRSLDSFCYRQRRARVRGSARRRGRPPGGPSNLCEPLLAASSARPHTTTPVRNIKTDRLWTVPAVSWGQYQPSPGTN